jgi:hypothetical protein
MEVIKELSDEEFEKYSVNDAFIHEVTWAHGCCDSNGNHQYFKAMTYYHLGTDFKVTQKQKDQARRLYDKRKEEILQDKGDKLLFVGMGMNFTPENPLFIGNHRIRTYFKNNDDVLCFVEFGTNRTNDKMRCDHALINTKQNNNEWVSLSERDGSEKRIKLLEHNINIDYTKQNVIMLVNKYFNCSFKEMSVEYYFITTDDYISEVKPK